MTRTNGKRPLPPGWRWVRLGDVFDIQQGVAMSPKRREGVSPRPFLRTLNVQWGGVDLSSLDEMDFTDEEVERLRLQPGDVLVCEGGDVGRTGIWRGELQDCVYQNHVHRLRKRDETVVPDFFVYWMQAAFQVFRAYGGQESNTTIPNLSAGRLKNFWVPCSPTSEQRRIAARLSEQMALVGKMREAARAQVEAARALPGALLRKVFKSEEAQSWPRVRLGDVCQVQLGKMLSPASKTGPRPQPYLRNANVQWGHIDLGDVYRMDFTPAEERKFALQPRDLLVCEGGEPGRAAVWNGEMSPCYYQKALHRVRPKAGGFSPRFLMYRLWAASLGGEFLESHARTTIAHLPAIRLRKLPLSAPPLADQDRVVEMLDTGLRDAEQVEAVARRRLEAVENLPNALLEKVFGGFESA